MALSEQAPVVGIIMGSTSDWETMRHAAETLTTLNVPHEVKVVSAHRTPKRLYDYAGSAVARGLKAVIAGAGGAAHLPGMAAAKTRRPVLGVPDESTAPHGLDRHDRTGRDGGKRVWDSEERGGRSNHEP